MTGFEQTFVVVADAKMAPPVPPDVRPDVDRTDLVRHYGVHLATIKNWEKRGRIPPPWILGGRGLHLWRRDHFEALVRTGRWPEEAWKGAP